MSAIQTVPSVVVNDLKSGSCELRLSAPELLIGIHAKLDESAMADYSGADPRARIVVYRDGSIALVFTDGHWKCERKFRGAGLREYSYIESDGKMASDLTTVFYRDKAVWQMFCSGVLDTTLEPFGIRLLDLIISSSAKSLPLGQGWHRGPPRFCWENGLCLTRNQIGDLRSLSGNEHLYGPNNEKVYSGIFIGGFVD